VSRQWSDDPALWEAMEPALCAPERLALAEGDVTAILAATGVPPGSRVLDLGCGPGAHAVALARREYRVTGVDTSSRLLERARSAARTSGVEVEWIDADVRDFRRPAAFDLVCSLYASFGYFDDRQNRRVLENVFASLAPGGALLLDLVGREGAARRSRGEPRWRDVNGALYLERSAIADDGSSMVSDWTVVRGGERAEFQVRQRLYSGAELRELLQSVGFAAVRLAGDLAGGTPYDESAHRLVALGRRPRVGPLPVPSSGGGAEDA
jgi:SAM-dependent methyltransferase